jgi:hypothetical protein
VTNVVIHGRVGRVVPRSRKVRSIHDSSRSDTVRKDEVFPSQLKCGDTLASGSWMFARAGSFWRLRSVCKTEGAKVGFSWCGGHEAQRWRTSTLDGG